MKISIKTIKGEVFPVEVEPSNTILDLKKKIEEVKKMDVATQKLILRGANTEDDKTLESYGVKEGDFLVVMQTKKLNTQPQQNPNPAPINPQPQPQQTQPKPTVTQPVSQGPSQQPQEFSQASASNVVLGDKFNQTVEEICKMGFPKDDVVKALKAAFNNPDRAIEYLINGIPENIEPQAHAHPQQNVPVQPHGHSQGHAHPPAGNLGGAGGQNPEAFMHLLNNPQFQMVRSMIRQNPQMLQTILVQLQQTNPELFNLITQNQDAFTRWLMETGPSGAGSGGNVIHVTQEEKDAIDRLVALGFEKQAAIQAYLACEKNEELAANFLFDQLNQGDFDEQPPARTVGGTGAQQQPNRPPGSQGQNPPAQGNPPPVEENKPAGQQGGQEKKEEEKPKEEAKPEDNKDKKNDKDDDDTIFS